MYAFIEGQVKTGERAGSERSGRGLSDFVRLPRFPLCQGSDVRVYTGSGQEDVGCSAFFRENARFSA